MTRDKIHNLNLVTWFITKKELGRKITPSDRIQSTTIHDTSIYIILFLYFSQFLPHNGTIYSNSFRTDYFVSSSLYPSFRHCYKPVLVKYVFFDVVGSMVPLFQPEKYLIVPLVAFSHLLFPLSPLPLQFLRSPLVLISRDS